MREDLIKRLENARGPDRELDRLIALACIPGARPHTPFEDQWIQIPSEIERDEYQVTLPDHYTASIDAALTLVPEGMGWAVANFANQKGWKGFHGIVTRNPVYGTLPRGIQESFPKSTPAIALCIAALRARAAIAAKDG